MDNCTAFWQEELHGGTNKEGCCDSSNTEFSSQQEAEHYEKHITGNADKLELNVCLFI